MSDLEKFPASYHVQEKKTSLFVSRNDFERLPEIEEKVKFIASWPLKSWLSTGIMQDYLNNKIDLCFHK